MAVRIGELRESFFNVASWVDRDKTCDRIIFGDPRRKVSKIGVGWTPCVPNLKTAADDGCELFISHEEFYYGHWAPGLDSPDTPWGRMRMEVLELNNMACMNQHDTWDNFPVYGIRDSWREFLGLGELLDERAYYNPVSRKFAQRNSLAKSRVEPQSFEVFAGLVAERCDIFQSSHGVTIHGDPEATVESVATGVGCHIPTLEMFELGADAFVLTFDRALQTTIRIPLAEMGANLIVIEHGVSEMPGMRNMVRYIEKNFPGVETKFYCEEPMARTLI